MSRREGSFAGAEGLKIAWQGWLPDDDATAVVVIAHGVSEHSGRYAHVAEGLTAHGYVVYALDHRGHGRSGGDRAVLDRMANVVADVRSMVTIARSEHPGVPAFLLGHSMGGAISLAYAIEHQDEIDGLILSGPAAALETASPVERAVAGVLSRLVPKLGVFGVDADAVSRDPEVVRDYETDPLNHHRKVPARTVAELASAITGFPSRVGGLRLGLLLLHGGSDSLVPVAASEMINEKAGSADKTLKVYPDLYHEILNEPEKAEVIADVAAWIEARRVPATAPR